MYILKKNSSAVFVLPVFGAEASKSISVLISPNEILKKKNADAAFAYLVMPAEVFWNLDEGTQINVNRTRIFRKDLPPISFFLLLVLTNIFYMRMKEKGSPETLSSRHHEADHPRKEFLRLKKMWEQESQLPRILKEPHSATPADSVPFYTCVGGANGGPL
ncbi:Hypothetical predicted protein, partial [Marmota monax]